MSPSCQLQVPSNMDFRDRAAWQTLGQGWGAAVSMSTQVLLGEVAKFWGWWHGAWTYLSGSHRNGEHGAGLTTQPLKSLPWKLKHPKAFTLEKPLKRFENQNKTGDGGACL